MQLAERERKKTMAEDPVSSFCNALAAFCNHLHSSSDALKQSIDRRPIPLGTLLSFSNCSVCLLRKFKFKFFHNRNRFRIVDLRAMPESPRIDRERRPRHARFHVLRHRLFRRAPRSLQRIVQEEPLRSLSNPRSSPELRL